MRQGGFQTHGVMPTSLTPPQAAWSTFLDLVGASASHAVQMFCARGLLSKVGLLREWTHSKDGTTRMDGSIMAHDRAITSPCLSRPHRRFIGSGAPWWKATALQCRRRCGNASRPLGPGCFHPPPSAWHLV